MALPELNSNILPDNEIVTIHTQDGAEVFSQVSEGNSVDSYVSENNAVYTTHNTVPQVLTVLKENGQDITTIVDGFWDVVWSVNGQTGDVIIDVVLGDFTPNTTFHKNAVIRYEGRLYRARETFTATGSFDADDWEELVTTTTPVVRGFIPNTHYLQGEMISVDNILYTANAEFTSGQTFDPQDWTSMGIQGIAWGEISGSIDAQEDLAEALASKQPTLTAGDNIEIDSNNQISATDTTYEPATDESDGLMSQEDKSKLDGIEAGAQANLPNTVVDADYVHTDNNYTDGEKEDVAKIDQIGSTVDTISSEIPAQASSSNQLADKNFVNSSINSVTAFYITKDAAGTQFNTKAELDAATVFYSGGEVRVPTRNDYCIVLSDETKTDPVTGENPTTRYIYQSNHWEFQYTVNKTSLTAAQLAAVNSNITQEKVTKLDGIEAGAQVNAANTVIDASYVHTDNNYTTAEKTKLAGIASGAEVNVQSDWGQTSTSADDYIKNKPTVPVITVQSTDPGEGATLAANHFIVVY